MPRREKASFSLFSPPLFFCLLLAIGAVGLLAALKPLFLHRIHFFIKAVEKGDPRMLALHIHILGQADPHIKAEKELGIQEHNEEANKEERYIVINKELRHFRAVIELAEDIEPVIDQRQRAVVAYLIDLSPFKMTHSFS